MGTKTIVFKNNRTLDVSQDLVNMLIEKIDNGATNFITFKNKEGKVETTININEIVCIA